MAGEILEEELITRLTLDTTQYLKNAQDARAVIDVMKTKLQELATTSKMSFKDLGAGMIADIKGMDLGALTKIFPDMGTGAKDIAQAQQTLISAVRTATTELTKEEKALKSVNDQGQKGTSIFSSFGKALQVAFGIGTYQLISKVVQALQQAMEAGYNFAKATYQLAIGINALRRSGIDITLKDMYENLDKLQKKFGVFSKVELVEGAAAFANLVRDMGFTKDQIFELQSAVATLAIVNGRAMDDVQRTVALALSSGYTEGLQRLGVSINRVNIALKAEELGYGRVYMSLTETQRGEATQILLLEKTAKYANDVATYQETLAGNIDITTSSIKDQSAIIGKELLPAMLMWKEMQSSLLQVGYDLIVVFSPLIELVTGLWHALEKGEQKAKENGKGIIDLTTYYTELSKAILRVINSSALLLTGKNAPNLEKLLGKEGIDKLYGRQTVAEAALAKQEAAATASADRIMDFMTKMAKEQLDLEIQMDADILKARDDFLADMLKLEEDNAKKIADIRAKYQETVDKIGAGLSKDIADAQKKASRDVADANRDANNRLAESNAKYRENQLKEEIDYQERLKKLREGFLMDLEDALRERDALAVLRAIRQYNLQKKQAAREHDIALDEMKRNHALELEELAKQRAERLRAIQQELADKIASIQAEAAIRIAEARKERDAELAEQAQAYTDAQAARQAQFATDIEDIKTKYGERLTEIAKNLALEYDLTQAELAKIATLYSGLNEYAAASARAAGQYLQTLMTKYAQIQALTTSLYPGMPDASKNWNFQANKKKAKGGIDYATTATSLTFGEAGPEMAITMPLTKSFSGDSFLNGNPISGLSSKGDRIDIALLLSPDLVAKVVRQSSDHVANVLMEVQRQ
jgi:hypothetical protein